MSANKKETRKAPVNVKPPVISARSKAKVETPGEVKKEIRKTGSAERVGGSGSNSKSKGLAVPIKKNLLPNKMNPVTLRVKANLANSSSSNTSGDRRQPLVPSSADKLVLRPASAALEDLDEDILDNLYSQYLKRRLMLQIILKKARLAKEKSAVAISTTALGFTLDRDKFRAQVHSLRSIQSRAEHLAKVNILEKAIDPLVESLLTEAMATKSEQLCERLSATMDILPVRNAKASLDDVNGSSLQEVHEEIVRAQATPTSSLGFLEELKQLEAVLNGLKQSCTSEDKQINEELMNIMSMKVSLSKLGQ